MLLKKGFIQKEEKEWAKTVRQAMCITTALCSYSCRISCLSVSRVVA